MPVFETGTHGQVTELGASLAPRSTKFLELGIVSPNFTLLSTHCRLVRALCDRLFCDIFFLVCVCIFRSHVPLPSLRISRTHTHTRLEISAQCVCLARVPLRVSRSLVVRLISTRNQPAEVAISRRISASPPRTLRFFACVLCVGAGVWVCVCVFVRRRLIFPLVVEYIS